MVIIDQKLKVKPNNYYNYQTFMPTRLFFAEILVLIWRLAKGIGNMYCATITHPGTHHDHRCLSWVICHVFVGPEHGSRENIGSVCPVNNILSMAMAYWPIVPFEQYNKLIAQPLYGCHCNPYKSPQAFEVRLLIFIFINPPRLPGIKFFPRKKEHGNIII